MEKLFLSLMLTLALVAVWCDESQPGQTEADPVPEVLELIRSMTCSNQQPRVDTGVESSLDESVEKRDLPRLGVSIHRPQMSRVKSSKSMDASRDRFSYPEWMARFHG